MSEDIRNLIKSIPDYWKLREDEVIEEISEDTSEFRKGMYLPDQKVLWPGIGSYMTYESYFKYDDRFFRLSASYTALYNDLDEDEYQFENWNSKVEEVFNCRLEKKINEVMLRSAKEIEWDKEKGFTVTIL